MFTIENQKKKKNYKWTLEKYLDNTTHNYLLT